MKGGNVLKPLQNLPPFVKGDRGGFCCAFVFQEITAAYLLYQQGFTIPPAQQVGFETTNP
jgi:hypothetical protein